MLKKSKIKSSTEKRAPPSSSTKQRAQQRVREQHTQEFQRWVSGCVVLEAFSSRARFICTTVVQIGVAPVPPRHETFRRFDESQYHFPPVLAAVGHSTVCTPNTNDTLSVDLSVARNTLRLFTRHWAKFVSGRPGLGFSPPAIVPNITQRISLSLCCPLYGPRKQETPLADGRLDALALCLIKGLGTT